MKRSIRIILAAAVVIIIGVVVSGAIEEAVYKVINADGKFEIRDYTTHILAETVVEGEFEEAGNEAFNGSLATSPATTGRATKWR